MNNHNFYEIISRVYETTLLPKYTTKNILLRNTLTWRLLLQSHNFANFIEHQTINKIENRINSTLLVITNNDITRNLQSQNHN